MPGFLPSFQQFRLALTRKSQDLMGILARQSSSNDSAFPDMNDRSVLAMLSVKVRVRVVTEIHAKGDAVKATAYRPVRVSARKAGNRSSSVNPVSCR